MVVRRAVGRPYSGTRLSSAQSSGSSRRRAESRNARCRYRLRAPAASCIALHERDRGPRSRASNVASSLRQRRRLGALAHIDPDEAVALGGLVGLGLDLVLEVAAAAARSAYRRNCRRRRISSRDRRSAARLPRCGRGTARRSDAGSDGPSRRPGRRLSRKAISFSPSSIRRIGAPSRCELATTGRRHPVVPHQLAHRRAGADPGQLRVIRCRRHRFAPFCSVEWAQPSFLPSLPARS